MYSYECTKSPAERDNQKTEYVYWNVLITGCVVCWSVGGRAAEEATEAENPAPEDVQPEETKPTEGKRLQQFERKNVLLAAGSHCKHRSWVTVYKGHSLKVNLIIYHKLINICRPTKPLQP